MRHPYDLVDVVDVALRHELVGAVVAVGDAVAEAGAVHADARHRATELPPLQRCNNSCHMRSVMQCQTE